MTVQLLELAYSELGSGLPLVLLHGFPLHREIWDDVKTTLASEARVILPDLRGHGASPLGGATSTMEEMAADVAALLDGLGIERAALAGHSMGGYVALAFARIFPLRVLALSLVASHPLADGAEQAAGRLANAERIEREGLAFMVKEMSAKLSANPILHQRIGSIIGENSSRGAAAAQRGMAARQDERQTLAALDVPGLIVCGDLDPFVSLQRSQQAYQQMKMGKLAIMNGTAHMPMMERPQETARALMAMLAEIK